MTSRNFSKFTNQLFSKKGNKDNRVASYARFGAVMFQVTTACNLNCTYCYETNKGTQFLTKEMAKKECDEVLRLLSLPDGVLGYNNIDGLELQFIGGEPLICVDVIDYIISYIQEQLFYLRPELLPFLSISISTNGYNLQDEKVRSFIDKYDKILFLIISIDGIKQVQDKYRITANGEGSFDVVYDNLYRARPKNQDNIKATFSIDSLPYLSESIIFFLQQGFRNIRYTTIYEDYYDIKSAKLLYSESKKIVDYIFENNIQDAHIYPFDSTLGQKSCSIGCVCESCGDMVCFTPNGKAYPCIRFCPTSIDAEQFCIGDVEQGVFNSKETCSRDYLKSIKAKDQMPKKCIDCPISLGCGWCNGYVYKKTGSLIQRTTGNCLSHQATTLAYYYYRNLRALKYKDISPIEIVIPDEWALEIVSQQELDEIKSFSRAASDDFGKNKKLYSII